MLLLLPSDLFGYLSSFLEGSDLLILSRVNSRLHGIVNNKGFLCRRLQDLSVSTLKKIIVTHTNRYHLTIDWCQGSLPNLDVASFDYNFIIGVILATQIIRVDPVISTFPFRLKMIDPSGRGYVTSQTDPLVKNCGYYPCFDGSDFIYRIQGKQVGMFVMQGKKNATIEQTAQQYIDILTKLLTQP